MVVVVLGKKRAYIKNDQKKCPKRYHELLGLFDFISCVLLHEKPLILMTEIEILNWESIMTHARLDKTLFHKGLKNI